MSQVATSLDRQDANGLGTDHEQFLTFRLEDEEYAVDILRVQEIRVWTPVTKIPNSPRYLKGVLNLRGTIIPIIDLRTRFALMERDYGPQTVVVILKVNSGDQTRVMGIVVDSVEETYAVDPASIHAAPHVGDVIDAEFIRGLISVDNKMIVLLDVDKLLNSAELAIDDLIE
ncbi:chemotaxis protein CheW [Pokkaliibacter sp. CJK22405]|uniref:chemotaxis protein CheW n=1 Tax=Pokkaliibacter sp. CJK22405 TaxID=3384615 RepID=UPI0039848F05